MASRKARPRATKFSAGITWNEVKMELKSLFFWFFGVSSCLSGINPLQLYRKWRRTGSVYSSEGSIIIYPTIGQRIRDSFTTESSRRRRLLDWVQSLLPDMSITDFKASWTNGVALCALMEALVPGACPEWKQLKPYHKLNNIRLALRLANRYLLLPMNAFRAEEIASNSCHHEKRVYEFLTAIRMLHQQELNNPKAKTHRRPSNENGENGSDVTGRDEQSSSSMFHDRSVAKLCSIRKIGNQSTGVIGEEYKFEVWFPDGLDSDQIGIEVVPVESLERYSLNSVTSGSDVELLIFGNDDENKVPISYGMEEFEPSTLNSMEDRPTNVDDHEIFLQSNKENLDLAEVLPTMYTYQADNERVEMKPVSIERSLEDGVLKVMFTPSVVGEYRVRATIGHFDIKGSPMSVRVTHHFESPSSEDESGSRKRLTFAQAAEMIVTKLRSSRIYRQLLDNTAGPTKGSKSLFDVAAAVLRRTSKVKRTLAYRGGKVDGLIESGKTVVRRRKVLRQTITRNGQDIVIDRFSSFDRSFDIPSKDQNSDSSQLSKIENRSTEEIEDPSVSKNNEDSSSVSCFEPELFLCSEMILANDHETESTCHASTTEQEASDHTLISNLNPGPSIDVYSSDVKTSLLDSAGHSQASIRAFSSSPTLRTRFVSNPDKIEHNQRDNDKETTCKSSSEAPPIQRSKSFANFETTEDQLFLDLLLKTESSTKSLPTTTSGKGSLSNDSLHPCSQDTTRNLVLENSLDNQNISSYLEVVCDEGKSPCYSGDNDKVDEQQNLKSSSNTSCTEPILIKQHSTWSSRREGFARQEAIVMSTPESNVPTVQESELPFENEEKGLAQESNEVIIEDDLCASASSVLMVDFSSQVSYEEIKGETGWTRPVREVQPRTKEKGSAHRESSKSRQRKSTTAEIPSNNDHENQLNLNSEFIFSKAEDKFQTKDNFQTVDLRTFDPKSTTKETISLKIPHSATSSAPSGELCNYIPSSSNIETSITNIYSSLSKTNCKRSELWNQLESLDGFFAFLDHFDTTEPAEEWRKPLRNDSYKKAMTGPDMETVLKAGFDLLNFLDESTDPFPVGPSTPQPSNQEISDERIPFPGLDVCIPPDDSSSSWSGFECRDIVNPDSSLYSSCSTFGPGLLEGHVGRRNYFQVRIMEKGFGYLGVEMAGHVRHSVLELNVTYIGDSLYDVTYEVSSPGIYVIDVKWAKRHVNGSPYVCKVSL